MIYQLRILEAYGFDTAFQAVKSNYRKYFTNTAMLMKYLDDCFITAQITSDIATEWAIKQLGFISYDEYIPGGLSSDIIGVQRNPYMKELLPFSNIYRDIIKDGDVTHDNANEILPLSANRVQYVITITAKGLQEISNDNPVQMFASSFNPVDLSAEFPDQYDISETNSALVEWLDRYAYEMFDRLFLTRDPAIDAYYSDKYFRYQKLDIADKADIASITTPDGTISMFGVNQDDFVKQINTAFPTSEPSYLSNVVLVLTTSYYTMFKMMLQYKINLMKIDSIENIVNSEFQIDKSIQDKYMIRIIEAMAPLREKIKNGLFSLKTGERVDAMLNLLGCQRVRYIISARVSDILLPVYDERSIYNTKGCLIINHDIHEAIASKLKKIPQISQNKSSWVLDA